MRKDKIWLDNDLLNRKSLNNNWCSVYFINNLYSVCVGRRERDFSSNLVFVLPVSSEYLGYLYRM